ncbi:MAG: D-aminoacyl-tRNA deacylase, partial [Alistipes sp.]|nr:D-aminoacyl-tRNA deacylase [Alistipes sp.]
MRLLVQRVRRAAVDVGGERISEIGAGLLVFVGIGPEDAVEDVEYLAGKLVRLRI